MPCPSVLCLTRSPCYVTTPPAIFTKLIINVVIKVVQTYFILDFKLSPCCERCILSFWWFPGVWILCADVSEHSAYSICCILSFEWFPGVWILCRLFGTLSIHLLYAFFLVIPQRLNFMFRRFGTLCLFHLLYSFSWLIPRRLNFMCRRFGTLSIPSVVCFLLGNSPASEFYVSTFRKSLSVPSSNTRPMKME
jgi:hypothetical protein